MFDEIGLDVAARLSDAAMVQAARLVARDLLAGRRSPREATEAIYAMYLAAHHPAGLAEFSRFGDWYDLLDDSVVGARAEHIDADVIRSARELADEG